MSAIGSSVYQVLIQKPVDWLKQPGTGETCRKCVAIFAAVILSLSIIGIPVVVLAYREWTRLPPAPCLQPVPRESSPPPASLEVAREREPSRDHEIDPAIRQRFLDALDASTKAGQLRNQCAERTLMISEKCDEYRKIIKDEMVQKCRADKSSESVRESARVRQSKMDQLSEVCDQIQDSIMSSANAHEADQRLRQGLETLERLKSHGFIWQFEA